MGRKRKKGESRRKPRHLLQCSVIGCGRRVNKLVADPRHPIEAHKMCCKKCARRFAKEQRRIKDGQEEETEIQRNGNILNL